MRDIEIQPLKDRAEISAKRYEAIVFPHQGALARLSPLNLESASGPAVGQFFTKKTIDVITPVVDHLGVLFEFARIKIASHRIYHRQTRP